MGNGLDSFFGNIGTRFGDAMINAQQPFGLLPGQDRQALINQGMLNLGTQLLASGGQGQRIGPAFGSAFGNLRGSGLQNLQALLLRDKLMASRQAQETAKRNQAMTQEVMKQLFQPTQSGVTAPTTQGTQPTTNRRLPRGIRNNNPGNIEYGPFTQRRNATGTDGRFAQFESPGQGITAMAQLLRSYQRDRGLNTVRQMISRYAPSSENDTNAYANAVAGAMGIDPDQPFDFSSDPALATSMVSAMIQHENGQQPYTPQQIQTAVAAGLGVTPSAGQTATAQAQPVDAVRPSGAPTVAQVTPPVAFTGGNEGEAIAYLRQAAQNPGEVDPASLQRAHQIAANSPLQAMKIQADQYMQQIARNQTPPTPTQTSDPLTAQAQPQQRLPVQLASAGGLPGEAPTSGAFEQPTQQQAPQQPAQPNFGQAIDRLVKIKAWADAVGNSQLSTAVDTLLERERGKRDHEQKVKEFQELQKHRAAQRKLTDDIKEYNFYREQGGDAPFMEWLLQTKKAGATQTNINLGQKEFSKKFGAKLADAASQYMEDARSATTNLGRIDLMRRAIEGGAQTGSLQAQLLPLKSYLADLGIEFEGLDKQQLISAVGKQLALEMRNPAGGAGMPGALSDADRRFLTQSVPGIEQDEKANIILLDWFERVQKRKLEVANMAAAYMRENGELDLNFVTQLQQWLNENSLFPEAAKKEGTKDSSAPKPPAQMTDDELLRALSGQ